MAVLDGVLTAAARTEAIAVGLKAGFPAGLQRIFDHRLCDAVFYGGNTQRSEFSVGFRNVDPLGGLGLPQPVICQLLHQLDPLSWSERRLAIDASRLSSRALLGHVSHGEKQVGVTA